MDFLHGGGLMRAHDNPSPARSLVDRVPARNQPDEPQVILLVEDDALIRMDTSEILRDLGHEVIEAEYGPDAVAVLTERSIDVLVTDVGLPGMSGIELADRARHLQPAIGVIFATGDRELPAAWNGQGSAVILCKPYDSKDLAECLVRARTRAQQATPREKTPDGGEED